MLPGLVVLALVRSSERLNPRPCADYTGLTDEEMRAAERWPTGRPPKTRAPKGSGRSSGSSSASGHGGDAAELAGELFCAVHKQSARVVLRHVDVMTAGDLAAPAVGSRPPDEEWHIQAANPPRLPRSAGVLFRGNADPTLAEAVLAAADPPPAHGVCVLAVEPMALVFRARTVRVAVALASAVKRHAGGALDATVQECPSAGFPLCSVTAPLAAQQLRLAAPVAAFGRWLVTPEHLRFSLAAAAEQCAAEAQALVTAEAAVHAVMPALVMEHGPPGSRPRRKAKGKGGGRGRGRGRGKGKPRPKERPVPQQPAAGSPYDIIGSLAEASPQIPQPPTMDDPASPLPSSAAVRARQLDQLIDRALLTSAHIDHALAEDIEGTLRADAPPAAGTVGGAPQQIIASPLLRSAAPPPRSARSPEPESTLLQQAQGSTAEERWDAEQVRRAQTPQVVLLFLNWQNEEENQRVLLSALGNGGAKGGRRPATRARGQCHSRVTSGTRGRGRWLRAVIACEARSGGADR